jgi:hypothetical protein
VFGRSAAGSLPTLQAIRGHYRAGNELVIHARPCLALLPAYMASLSNVQHLRILGALWANLMQLYRSAGDVTALTHRVRVVSMAEHSKPCHHMKLAVVCDTRLWL